MQSTSFHRLRHAGTKQTSPIMPWRYIISQNLVEDCGMSILSDFAGDVTLVRYDADNFLIIIYFERAAFWFVPSKLITEIFSVIFLI